MSKFARLFLLGLIIVLFFSVGGNGAVAETRSQIRQKIGIKLFRTMLAADMDITNKGRDGELFILLLYRDSQNTAKKIGEILKKSKKHGTAVRVRGMPIKIIYTSSITSPELDGLKIAGICITQQLQTGELEKVIKYGINNRLIVYSPFEGDVEKGVLGGLSVQARVRPFLNAKTLKASKIQIKPFFMKVTKFHE